MSTARQELEEARRFGLLDDAPDLQLHGTADAYAMSKQFEDKFQDPPLPQPEEDEAELITIALRADDPLLQALMESSNQDGKAVIEHALQVGIDFLRLEAMDALTRTYELKIDGLAARLRALRDEAIAAEAPVMPPKSPLKRFWSMLNDSEKD